MVRIVGALMVLGLLATTRRASADGSPSTIVRQEGRADGSRQLRKAIPPRAVSFYAALTLEHDASPRWLTARNSLAPDIWVIQGAWTVGLVHSGAALGEVSAYHGLCVHGQACDDRYQSLGVDVQRHMLGHGAWSFAPRVRMVLADTAPYKPTLRLGATMLRQPRGGNGWQVSIDPHVRLGLARRDEGSRDWFTLPLMTTLRVRWFELGLRTGVAGELRTFSETMQIPVALVTALHVGRVDVGVTAGFPMLLGPLNDPGTRMWWLSVGTGW